MSADAPFQGDQLTRIQGVHDDPAVIPRTWAPVLLTILLALLVGAAPAAGQPDTRARLQDQLDGLVAAAAGPPGVLVTLHRGSRTTVLTAGVADVASGRRPRATDHMRIASMAKAFSGAIVFRLVTEGRLRLGDTIGEVLPGLPWRWRAVSVRRMLDHTSGLPDYTQSDGFRKQFQNRPGAFVSPQKVIGWVRREPLVFRPGSRYEYSNTDNIVVGLMAEKVTGRRYGRLLRRFVFQPLGLRETSFPTTTALPRPFIHGYQTEAGSPPQDVSRLLNPSGAWASGAIVSTPREIGTFIRGLLGARLFPRALQRRQLRFVAGGRSSPPGPGRNSAGLAVFRYRTRCGTVYGHTGNFPGYVQWMAATRDGRRSVTSTLNIPAPTGSLLRQLREMQETAVCLLLRG
jgi:D-alanyl-D-alanine carboxypeptidase